MEALGTSFLSLYVCVIACVGVHLSVLGEDLRGSVRYFIANPETLPSFEAEFRDPRGVDFVLQRGN